MRKIIFFLSVSVIFFFLLVDGFAQTLELVTLQYPPYEYLEGSEIKGIAVDLVREAFKRMGQPINIELLPWVQVLKSVEEGKSDAFFTAFKTPERETFADYSKEVLMPQSVSLYVLKDSPIVFDGDLRKLNKYTFGVARKLSYGRLFDNAVENGIITKIEVSESSEENIKRFLEGRIDILVSNSLGSMYILKKLKKWSEVRELAELEKVPSFIAFSKKRNLGLLRDRFDKVLKKMKDDGTYEKIIDSYLEE